MTLSQQVLEALENSRGHYLSGEALAERFYVSRNAVWKAIRQLRTEGHDIHAVPNRGYALSAESGALSASAIARHVVSPFPLEIQVHPSLDSTNTYLKKLAEEGAPEGTVVISEEQTAGRGRRGRSFYSPSRGGIYMSLLLRPSFSAEDSLAITTCGAVAVCRALERLTQATPSIKWVNDVFCHGLKVCGIATEGALDLENGGLTYAVLGIGINLFPGETPIPPELTGIVGTVLPTAPSDGDLRNRVIAEVLTQFLKEYPSLTEKAFFTEYRDRCFLLGQPINILRGTHSEPAEVLGLSSDFRLEVRRADGTVEQLSSGEVSVRPTASP